MWTIGYGEIARGQFYRARVVDFYVAAFLLIKRKAIEEVGRLPGWYFMRVEVGQWCAILHEPPWKPAALEAAGWGVDATFLLGGLEFHSRRESALLFFAEIPRAV